MVPLWIDPQIQHCAVLICTVRRQINMTSGLNRNRTAYKNEIRRGGVIRCAVLFQSEVKAGRDRSRVRGAA